MSQSPRGQRRLASTVALLVLKLVCTASYGSEPSQEADQPLSEGPVTSCSPCTLQEDEYSSFSCFISECLLEGSNSSTKLPLADLRGWLPQYVLAFTPENSSIILSDVIIRIPRCEPVWALQAEACTFRVSTFWPSAGLQTGAGFVFFPLLNTWLSSGAIAYRLNVTCPKDQWPELQAAAPGSLLPCGTATVTSGADLITALADLQPSHLRLLITIAANISLPASPTPLRGPASRYANTSASAADAPTLSLPFFDYWTGSSNGSSGSDSGSSSDGDDDSNPLVVIIRNTTLVGLSGPGSASTQPTELNLRCRRNAFKLQQPSGKRMVGSSSGGTGTAARVVFVVTDMTLVNVPPGPPLTWPLGLLSADMWHMGLDRSAAAPVQLIHLRLFLVLNFGQTKYFNHWYTRLISVVDDEERAGAAWLQQLITPTVPVLSEDGVPINRGMTRTFIDKYNVSATAVPLLTPPLPSPVDLWTLDDPPVHPDSIGFAATAQELHEDLNTAWTGPRVVVLLGDIGFDGSNWPKDGIQLASSVTLAGPIAAASPPPPSSSSNLSYTPPKFNMYGLPFVRVPQDMRVSFRNIHVLNLSVSVSWALPEAPEVLPGVPGYAAWRTRCLPGFMDNVMGRFEMHGCEVYVPPDVFGLLRIFNSPMCAHSGNTSSASSSTPSSGGDGNGYTDSSSRSSSPSAPPSVNCTNYINVTAAGFSYLTPALTTFFDRVFRASGQYALTPPNSTLFYFAAHTLTGIKFNSTAFRMVDYPAPSDGNVPPAPAPTPPSSSSPSPSSSSSSSSSFISTCSLQSLFGMLLAAPRVTSTSTAPSTASLPAPKEHSAPPGAVIGGAVGGAVLGAVLVVALVVFVRSRRRRSGGPQLPVVSEGAGPKGSSSGVEGSSSQAAGAAGAAGTAVGGGGGAGGSGHRDAACLLTCGPGGAAAGGGKAGGGLVREGQVADVPVAAAAVRLPDGRLQMQQMACLGAAVEGGDGECCSAFSQSFMMAEPTHGRAPTMLEQLLCKQAEPSAPPMHHPRQPPAALLMAGPGGFVETAGGARFWGDRAVDADGTARRAGSGRGGGGGGANNNGYDNRDVGGSGGGPITGTAGTALTTGTAVSGSGEGAHRALAGEIDGMIRRYEATSVGAGSAASQGTQRQHVLGSGGFGVVYKGQWRGLPVAIKVVLLQEGDSAIRRERLVREVALSATLSHPNVVATYHYTVQPVAAASLAGCSTRAQTRPAPRPGDVAAAAPPSPPPRSPRFDFHDDHDVRAYKLSIVMAYCDKGTLRDALRGGLFRRPWPPLATAGGFTPGHPSGPPAAAAAATAATAAAAATVDAAARAVPAAPAAAWRGAGEGGRGCSGSSPTGGEAGVGGGGGGGGCPLQDGAGGAAAAALGAPREWCAALPPGGGRTLAYLHVGPVPYSRCPGTPAQPQASAGAANRPSRPQSARGFVASPGSAAAGTGVAGGAGSGTAGTAGATGGEAADLAAAAVCNGAASPRALRSPPLLAAGADGRLTWDDVRPAPNQALALFAALDVARGLEYLHACNVVHGDLSLQNILLTTSDPIFSDAVLAASACASAITSNGLGPPPPLPAAAVAAAGSMYGTSGVPTAARLMQTVMHRLLGGGSGSTSASGGTGTATVTATGHSGCTAVSPAAVAIAVAEPQLMSVSDEAVAGAATAAPVAVGPPPPPPAPPPPAPAGTDPHDTVLRPQATAADIHVDTAACEATVALSLTEASAVRPLAKACTTPGTGNEFIVPVTPDSAEAPQASASLWASSIAAAAATAADVTAGGGVAGKVYDDAAAAAVAIVFPSARGFPGDGDGTSGEADASTAAEPLGGPTASTATQSETLWGFSLSLGDQTPAASAGGGGRVLSVMRRVAAVQPLLLQVFKISDFGLSVRLEGDETHRSGLHQGTPYYTATEVLVSGKVSPAADIYSYGVCLWCLVHGVSLCQLRHLLPPMFTPVAPALLARISLDLPPAVRNLVRRCLAGDPGRRPNAAALVQELQTLVQAAVGPELAPLLLGAERRERDMGRTVAGLMLSTIDSGASNLAAVAAAQGAA